MEKRDIALRLLEIDAKISHFMNLLEAAGLDSGQTVLAQIDITGLIGEMYGLSEEETDCLYEEISRVNSLAEAMQSLEAYFADKNNA